MLGDSLIDDNCRYKDANIVFCNAISCYNKAVKTKTLNVGKFGNITLRFCDKCVLKFREDKRGN